ncbi:MAG: nuclear transport factor 2 family protein [Armatimonadetes bacterium]|nr:nuclear transport factor 2 family protein [Armatimonadota bacterium]
MPKLIAVAALVLLKPPPPLTKGQIVEVLNRSNRLFVTKNYDGLMKLLTADYNEYDTKGSTFSREEVGKRLKVMFTIITKIRVARSDLMSFRPVIGGTQVVTRTILDLDIVQAKRKHRLQTDFKSVELWVRQAGQIRVRTSKVLSETSKMDGKTVASP